jgi:excisionase family DNA binding protein
MNVGKATVYELIASGKLPAHRVGNGRGTIRVRPEDLAAFEQSSLPAAGDAGDWSLARIRELA